MRNLISSTANLISQLYFRFQAPAPTSSKQPREIVSSYICSARTPAKSLEFALFKRSQDVSIYRYEWPLKCLKAAILTDDRGKWAVCSGSIKSTDITPEEAARREIFEETKLSRDDIRLLRKGEPFILGDEKLGTEWKIHPFVWQLKEVTKVITLDSEHTEYCFVKPEDLHKFDHVPLLEISTDKLFNAKT